MKKQSETDIEVMGELTVVYGRIAGRLNSARTAEARSCLLESPYIGLSTWRFLFAIGSEVG